MGANYVSRDERKGNALGGINHSLFTNIPTALFLDRNKTESPIYGNAKIAREKAGAT